MPAATTPVPITEEQNLMVLGLTTMLISERKKLDRMRDIARKILRDDLGAREGQYKNVESAIDEAVYNEGDDPEEAAESIRTWLGLEVAE